MKQAVWTPSFDDGSIRDVDLDRPSDADEPTTWQVPFFHGGAPPQDVAAVFGIMAGCPRHTFRVLVQDVAVLADWFHWVESFEHVDPVSVCEIEAANRTDVDQLAPSWPLPNVTLVSPVIRTQAEADRMLPALLGAKAARREAVFAPREMIDVGDYLDRGYESGGPQGWIDLPSLDAVRVRGGETPMHPAWIRKLQEQARMAGVDLSLAWGDWTVRGPGMSDDEPRVRLGENKTRHESDLYASGGTNPTLSFTLGVFSAARQSRRFVPGRGYDVTTLRFQVRGYEHLWIVPGQLLQHRATRAWVRVHHVRWERGDGRVMLIPYVAGDHHAADEHVKDVARRLPYLPIADVERDYTCFDHPRSWLPREVRETARPWCRMCGQIRERREGVLVCPKGCGRNALVEGLLDRGRS